MEEDSAIIFAILKEEAELNGEIILDDNNDNNVDQPGWQTVPSSKRNQKNLSSIEIDRLRANGGSVVVVDGEDSSRSVDKEAKEQRRRIIEAQRAALEAASLSSRSGPSSDSVGYSSDVDESSEAVVSNAGDEVAKKKKYKKKKPKVTVAQAAASIDADNLFAFFTSVSAEFEGQEETQLKRFAEYFECAFGAVSLSMFPWAKTLKESKVEQMIDMPLKEVPEPICKATAQWLGQKSADALASFVLTTWDAILSELAIQKQKPVKNSRPMAQPAPSKSQVAMLFVMASVLRRKPELLMNLLPSLKEGPKYIEHDKLPLTIWVIAQASEEDMVVGLYIWIQALLPMLSGKSCNPKSRDLILQLVERTISSPKALQTLVGGAVRKGERIIPPQAFDILMRLTFPSLSKRIKATERFEAAYPILKEVALAGTSQTKAMKHVSTQVFTFAMKAVGEGVPGLTQEASDVLIWCLTQEPYCYKEWDNLYPRNIQASSAILKKISDECKEQPTKYTADLDKLMVMLNGFRKKNKEALTRKEYADKISYFNEADKHCKDIQKQLSRSSGCLKATVAISVASVVAVTAWSHGGKVVGMEEVFEKLSQLRF